MSTYTGPDEYPIGQIPSTPWWSENFAAMYFSPTSRIAIYYSIGRWHSDPQIWRESIMVALPDKRILFHRGYARSATELGPGSSLSRYEVLEPGKKTRLRFDGPMSEASIDELIDKGAIVRITQRCAFDLEFHGTAPVWNMKGDSVEAQTMAGSMHIDHIGTIKGQLSHAGTTYDFDGGYAVRDHSRGIRDVTHYGGHSWLNGAFPDGTAFYVYAMRVKGSSEIGMPNAAVARDGKLYPAKILQLQFAESAGDYGKLHEIVLSSELGEMRIAVTEVLHSFPIGMTQPYDVSAGTIFAPISFMMFDESVRMTWNGQEGAGWSERGFA